MFISVVGGGRNHGLQSWTSQDILLPAQGARYTASFF